MRAIWSGAIGFGLVNIPVKLLSATQEEALDLDMLDRRDHAAIKYHRVNADTGREVAWDDIVKGFKTDSGYVILEDSDFEQASPEQTKMIEIGEFVEETDIDPSFFETVYFLQPDKSGARAYALLRDALKKTAKAGVGSFVLRNRESPVLVRPSGNVLLLHRLRFANELRDPAEVTIPAARVRPDELKMAVDLIGQMSESFDPSRYHDTYNEKLLKLIRAKEKGKKPATKVVRVPTAESRDLLSRLRESLAGTTKKVS